MPARASKPTHVFVDNEGRVLRLSKAYAKLYRDVLRQHLGEIQGEKLAYTPINVAHPTEGVPLLCGIHSPLCLNCGLFEHECKNPFIRFSGSSQPLATFVFDSVSAREDNFDELATEGSASGVIKGLVEEFTEITQVPLEQVRFVSLTRCANRLKKTVNYKTKGNYCRLFFLQDLLAHPPRIIVPVGSIALGLLSHKSNAQVWGGKLLTWRGWPDDWLVNPEFVKPVRILIAGKGKGKTKEPDQEMSVIGHPLLGSPPGPEQHRLLFPIQTVKIINSYNNEKVTRRWKRQIIQALKLAKAGAVPRQYVLPHYRILTDPQDVKDALQRLIHHPGTQVAYDTETEGLHPFKDQKIVFMMFRYKDPKSDELVAFGFPWDYTEDAARGPASPLLLYLSELKPYVEEALKCSVLVGHNTTFDALFTFKALAEPESHVPFDAQGKLRPEWRKAQGLLNGLSDAFVYDTWHMAYTRRQERGSLGLEVLAYEHAPELAGYEEEFTLLLELERARMHPDEGGHYARCPEDKWETHLKPYVMGDVEVCYRCRESLQAKLDNSIQYRFPLAHPTQRGAFRYFSPPDRAWLYSRIMSPAARMLTKIMGRGMHIDQQALSDLEDWMPKAILESIGKMREVGNGVVNAYIDERVRTDDHRYDPEKRWEFDLEKKDQLRDILFTELSLEIQRLTKTGRKLYGEDPEGWHDNIRAAIRAGNPEISEEKMLIEIRKILLKYAALDKFTLNKLAVDHEEVRPLQEYRKIHKLYSTYVRPLRNMRFVGIDKKARTAVQHLCPDGCIHAQFLLTGTRGGRLSSRSPNLQQLPKEGVRHHSMDLQVKRMYASRFGEQGCLYSSDFSQIELRLLAAASGDPSMVKAYFEDADLHTLTASRIFELPYETFSKEYRRDLENSGHAKEAKDLALKRDIAKTTNFLTGYGGGALGLQTTLASKQIYRSIEECEYVIETFFDSYPAVKALLGYYKRFIEDNEVAVSIFGRVRVFEEVKSGDMEAKSKALRAGCNHLIQSTASDMMLICLVVIEQLMREEGLDSMLVSTVHDSLVIDALRHELPQIHEITNLVLNNMPEVFKTMFGDDYDTSWMLVPFAGDSEVGHSYGDMRGIGKGDPDWDKLLAKERS